jgi:hypothetical protein
VFLRVEKKTDPILDSVLRFVPPQPPVAWVSIVPFPAEDPWAGSLPPRWRQSASGGGSALEGCLKVQGRFQLDSRPNWNPHLDTTSLYTNVRAMASTWNGTF